MNAALLFNGKLTVAAESVTYTCGLITLHITADQDNGGEPYRLSSRYCGVSALVGMIKASSLTPELDLSFPF